MSTNLFIEMKQASIYKIVLLILAGVLIFTSCEKDEITSISFDKASLYIKVGLSDTLTCTIQYTGDIAEFPIEWQMTGNNDVFEFTEIDDEEKSTSSKHTLTKKIIVKALEVGTSNITISVGGKSHICEVTVSQQIFIFTKSITGYWGDWYDIELNAFDMFLIEKGLHFNSYEDFEGTGHILYLDFKLNLNYTNSLSTGQYFISETVQPQGFEPGEIIEHEDDDKFSIVGSYLEQIVSKERSLIYLVTGGNYKVKREGDIYIIDGTLELHTNEVIRFMYEGKITIEDNRPKAEILKPVLTDGFFEYLGDIFDSKTTNNFMLYLFNTDDDNKETKQAEDVLIINFNTDLSVKDSIPSGTYTMMKTLTYGELKEFTLIPGQIDEDGLWGCWYLSDSIHSYEPYVGDEGALKIKSGDMEVSKADSVYTITYDFRNRFGSKISGVFEGVLEYEDVTKQQPENIQAAGQAKIKGLNTLRSSKLPIHKLQQQRLSPINQWFKHHNPHPLKQAERLPEKVKVVSNTR